MDPGEESFTLSSLDFNFKCVLSDDEDNDYNYEQQHGERNKDDVDAYIELELPTAALAASPLLPPLPSQVAASDDDDDEELGLRISFSAVAPFPGFSTTSANIVSSKPLFSTCEGANSQLTLTVATGSPPLQAVESTLACVHRRPLGNHSTISIFPTRFPPPVGDNCHRSVTDINSWELFRRRNYRKPSPAANGGIMKLLLKLRSIVISGLGSMRESLAQAGNQAAQKRCPSSRRLTSMKPFDRWFALCKPSEPQQRMTAVRTNGGGSSEMRSPSKVKEMKFGAMRKLFFGSAVSRVKSYNGISKSGRLNKSCPTSIKSSPIHQSGDASLVHAAIAHCKRSFGQNDEFSF